MKRLSIVALAAGAMALSLAGCGSDQSVAATGQKQAASSTSVIKPLVPAASVTPVAPVIEPPADAPTTATVVKKTTAPDGAQTTCGDFRNLSEDAEQQVIQQVLAANPGSFLDGNPHSALSTAKLACLSGSYTDTPVAVAIRVSAK